MFWKKISGRPGNPTLQQGAADREREILLTIVTVNRNNAANLGKTLASLRQLRDHPEVQFVFIDGASTDASVEIACQFYRPEELASEPDSGIYNAMNKGLYRARGRYVLWLNSGDELLPSMQERVFQRLCEGGFGMLSFGVECVDPGIPEHRHWIPTAESLPLHTLPHAATFFDRRAVLRCGGYNEWFRISGDKDLMLRLYFADEKLMCDDAIIARFYAGGISSRREREIEDLYIAGKFEAPSVLKAFYWWLVADYRRGKRLWNYGLFRAKLALRR